MKISVVCWLRNDHYLAPFFLNHYSFADEIVALVDDATTDDTAAIVAARPNTKVISVCSENANVRVLSAICNKFSNAVIADWVISPCNDEFIFPPGGGDIREAITQADGNVIYANMWQVYRHRTDKDLDPMLPTVPQRRHGDPIRMAGFNAMYNKPIIYKPGIGIELGLGMHACVPNPIIRKSTTKFDGAHWLMADPELAILRRMRGARKNQDAENLNNGWGVQHFNVTEKSLRAECDRHLDDPQLF